jgi:leucyl/phenylalanyl-tRNA---protein transferase
MPKSIWTVKNSRFPLAYRLKLEVLGDDPTEFPPSHYALKEPNGLLAVGGDLSLPRLISAYKRGLFPWFSADQPILWWSPDPRTVFIPGDIHCSRSMAKFIRQSAWQLRIDSNFAAVIDACSWPRMKSSGTWITPSMKSAYIDLHYAGYAHSIEVWSEQYLVGGLYGVGIGKAFFGESMFSARPNASKMALIGLSKWLHKQNFLLFDCQVENDHLLSLGAQQIPRGEFERLLLAATPSDCLKDMQQVWRMAKGKQVSHDGYLCN